MKDKSKMAYRKQVIEMALKDREYRLKLEADQRIEVAVNEIKLRIEGNLTRRAS
jgi:hypothetical protein